MTTFAPIPQCGTKTSARSRLLPFLLKRQTQRHLHLPRAANRLVHVSQSKWAIVEVADLVCRSAARREHRRALGREAIVKLVLGNGVDGNVEACGVRYIEHVEAEAESHALRYVRELHERNIHALLPGLAENVALSGCKVGFVGVVGGDCAAQITGLQERNRKAGRIQGRNSRGRAAMAAERTLRRATWRKRDDRIRDSIRNAVKCAADRAAVVNDAERLTALENRQPFHSPAIRKLGFDRVQGGGEFRRLVDVVEI